MNQLISNVLMQPKPDATEHLTLVEKLEREVKRLSELRVKTNPYSLQYPLLGHHIVATINAINIVKQHSEWVRCDERLPDKFWDDDKKYYCRVDTMGCIDFKILVWRYGDWHNLDLSPLGQKGFTVMPKVTHYFELPQPPSEVQDD